MPMPVSVPGEAATRLIQILSCAPVYQQFLTVADTNGVGADGRFIFDMLRIPWNGNTPLQPQTAEQLRRDYTGSVTGQLQPATSSSSTAQGSGWGVPIDQAIRRVTGRMDVLGFYDPAVGSGAPIQAQVQ